MKSLQYIITGTGRCGTVFLAKWLSSIGIPCGHESIFNVGGLNGAIDKLSGKIPIESSYLSKTYWKNEWLMESSPWLEDESDICADSSYMAAPYLTHDILQDTKVIHVVRDPLLVINSLCNYLNYFAGRYAENPYDDFIYKNCPELTSPSLTQFEKGALFYVLWNEMIEQRQCFFYRIEDSVDLLYTYLNKIPQKNAYNDTKSNSWERPCNPFSLESLPNGEIKRQLIRMGRRYGYFQNIARFV